MKNILYSIKTGKVIILLLLILCFFSCDEKQNPVPNVYVDILIPLNDPQYSSITVPGNFLYLTGGVNGILLIHTVDDQYKAYDRTCTYDPDCGTVSYNENTFRATDTVCCGSEFSMLVDGIVEQGPAEFPLKQYACIYNQNSNTLQIRN